MTDEESKKPKRRWIQRCIPRTVASRTAVVTAIALFTTLIVVWSLRAFGIESVRLRHAMTLPRMAAELGLTLAIPWALYLGLSRWNQVIEGVYPDVDRAWQAGVEAIKSQGIDLADYPLYLILGSSETESESGLMQALNSKLRVQAIPNEPGVSQPLQWYLTEDAIYLFCSGASALSGLMSRWTNPESSTSVRRPVSTRSVPAASPVATHTSPNAARADVSDGIPERDATAPPEKVPDRKVSQSTAPDHFMGTLQSGALTGPSSGVPVDRAEPSRPSMTASRAAPPPEPRESSVAKSVTSAMRPAPSFQGTLSLGALPSLAEISEATDEDEDEVTLGPLRAKRPSVKKTITKLKPDTEVQQQPRTPVPSPSTAERVALPAALDTSDQIPRLQYVCELLGRVRRPRCGINGTVTLIPFGLSKVGPLQLSAISQSVRGDVETIQQTLGVRAPVTAVLVGLEQDKGFSELVRRLQPGLLNRRLGGRFDLRSKPTPEELNVHSDRLCDAFEDWVYRLFGREDALAQQRGNRKLYALISRIRHELKPRLRIVLGQAFGCQSTDRVSESDDDHSFFFSGCYFASSGVGTGKPAFVQGVLKDKLADEQSQVQWTTATNHRQRAFRGAVMVGWFFAALMALLLVVKSFLL
ncbi:MAG: type VI secretion protein IcmF/TssM N-terminal domain-containing protein [Planctomycetota bacterium]